LIISRTPFRISFAGGGTDLPAFYRREPGAVVSTAINKYMYITLNCRFDNSIRVSYSRTEIVEKVDEIQHPIVREALMLTGITSGIEIVSIADVPAGTGLGSSSSFTVGLLNALYAFKGELKSAEELAAKACHIEIELLGEPIGKQDQYIAAYGGLRCLEFNRDDSVFVHLILCDKQYRDRLKCCLLLLYTGESRLANRVLARQTEQTSHKATFARLKLMRDQAGELRRCLTDRGEPEEIGRILHSGWLLKRELVGGITNDEIDALYDKALKAGAYGGKISGAGGGGFLLLATPAEKRQKVREALGNLRELEFDFEPEGSKIIYVE
jgi:D-glycero-alpha-D-manno-heptose-7-phosphate kinase